MDTYTLRRQNLRRLVDRHAHGNMAEFGRLIERERAQVKQYLSADYNDGRSIGEKVARHIEKKLELSQGWLDQPSSYLSEPAPSHVAEPTPAYVTNSEEAWPFKSIALSQLISLPSEDISRLEGALALALAQLQIGLEVSPLLQPSAKLVALENIAATSAQAANDNELIEIRKAAVKIVGGDPVVAIDHGGPEFNGVIYLAKSWLMARGLSRDKVFAATVKGDSMAPRIQEGDLLLINQGDTTKRSGHVYGLSHDGKFMVKRLKKDGRHWCLMSDNPEHPPITADENTKVIGRVALMKTEQV